MSDTAPAIDRDRFEMRKPCPACASMYGFIVESNGQDVVRCLECNRHVYNAPRTETGRAKRTVTTVHNGIKPHVRAKILMRDGRCLLCNTKDAPLHVGHILSVEAGLACGLSDQEINHDENLMAMCAECNLGAGAQPIPLRVAVAILRARISWNAKHEGK